ncbi:hypothetical protein TCAL_06915 [Tigriopus californicus]|uniref:Uncharacterized protein n=1 Tax=Tigriopus californicus TaxID=6832 RepID=A0A553PJW6_TIGCA|nr:uncharacterized protein LOC131889989 [Tigriopus californicus]XP_059095214.1 uncharacterized protein LOC131889989 [Tigriopus californicus]TRY77974.1 hypothetical protein TCAL_06915 [Tigriopus californicus]|eukprot:TCALIF_06915-PA protein Name:"Protein of unknown function" AED:0.00 eAED:0.00 QI:23/1/1/1/1/1/3/97/380
MRTNDPAPSKPVNDKAPAHDAVNPVNHHQYPRPMMAKPPGSFPMYGGPPQMYHHSRFQTPHGVPWGHIQGPWGRWSGHPWAQPPFPWPRPVMAPPAGSNPEAQPKAKEVWTNDPKDEGFWRSVAHTFVGGDHPRAMPQTVTTSTQSQASEVVLMRRGAYAIPSGITPNGSMIHAPDGTILRMMPNSNTVVVQGRHQSVQTELNIPPDSRCILIPETTEKMPMYMTWEDNEHEEEQEMILSTNASEGNESTDSDLDTPQSSKKLALSPSEIVKATLPQAKSVKVVLDNQRPKDQKTPINGISILKHPITTSIANKDDDFKVTIKAIKIDHVACSAAKKVPEGKPTGVTEQGIPIIDQNLNIQSNPIKVIKVASDEGSNPQE